MDEGADLSWKSDRRITVFFIAILVCAAILGFYTDIFGSASATIAALVVVPAALGGLVSNLTDPRGTHPQLMGCFVWPTILVIVLLALGYFMFRDGIICFAMAAPLWFSAAIAGALVNRWNARRYVRSFETPPRLHSVTLLVLPITLLAVEGANPPDWSHEQVASEIVVDASSDKVWPYLVNIRDIGGEEGKFNLTQDVLGVPRPTDAAITYEDGRPVREAQWGADVRFEERIANVLPGKHIAWDFAFVDDSVRDHTDRHIAPDGSALKISSGSYELISISPTQTRVRLITNYALRTRLASYASWWGELLLGDIQENVLTIIKERAERSE